MPTRNCAVAVVDRHQLPTSFRRMVRANDKVPNLEYNEMTKSNENDKAAPARSYVEEAACAIVYYAAERTLMAWVRVAVGMMALGFVIDRYGLVLRMMPRSAGAALQPTIYTFGSGTTLVLGGALMAVVAAVRYTGIELRFRRVGGAGCNIVEDLRAALGKGFIAMFQQTPLVRQRWHSKRREFEGNRPATGGDTISLVKHARAMDIGKVSWAGDSADSLGLPLRRSNSLAIA